jgi:hypothetical protein
LAGATATLASPQLQAVIMELNGSGALYGFDEDSLHRRMLSDGFRPCRYEPNGRRVVDLDGQRGISGNTLYLRDPHAAQARLGGADKYRVTGIEI